MSTPNYPEHPYDSNATAQAPISPPGNNTTTNDAKLRAQAEVQDKTQMAQEKAQMAQEKARQLGSQVRSQCTVDIPKWY
ncbi:hypothetical protein BN14_05224 [Rhizoctonia solani AG-1 IB]|uniref:Uncharacterized protein n=1 Tax=Thanatephorus cucumeris (strain AG1-IB / isolate 7/3/14) TaxID=1108050 RepID=M5BVI6_THACB|nr:hypothetical protein BN14_05224 [Rhizoctonia solani AG-1 IB]